MHGIDHRDPIMRKERGLPARNLDGGIRGNDSAKALLREWSVRRLDQRRAVFSQTIRCCPVKECFSPWLLAPWRKSVYVKNPKLHSCKPILLPLIQPPPSPVFHQYF